MLYENVLILFTETPNMTNPKFISLDIFIHQKYDTTKRIFLTITAKTLSLDNTKKTYEWLYKQIYFAQRKTILQTRHWISKIVQSLILGLTIEFA